MYRAYFVSSVNHRKEISKAQTLEECRKAFQKSCYWQYIIYLIEVKQLLQFDEYIYIVNSAGDLVFDTKQKIEEEALKSLEIG